MNQIGIRIREDDNLLASGDESGGSNPISFDRLFAMMRRQLWVLGIGAFLGLCLGIVYLATTPKSYWATSRVLIDDRLNKIVDQVAETSSILRDDTSLSSQIEIIRSHQLAIDVITQLGIDEFEPFSSPPQSLTESLSQSFRDFAGGGVDQAAAVVQSLIYGADPNAQEADDAAEAPEPTREQTIATLARGLRFDIQVSRVGRSNAIEIGYLSYDPWLSTAVVNKYADAYRADQLNATFDATRRTAEWIQNRLGEVYASSQAAALEVETFRAANGLSATGGQLITEQKLSQLNLQLAQAEAEAARARALMAQYQEIVDGGTAGLINFAILSPNLTNDERISELQERFVTVSSRLATVEQDFGTDHPQAQILRNEQSEIAEVIFAGFTRLLQQVRGEYEISQAREDAIRASVDAAADRNTLATQSQVKLRELEQRAQAQSTLYENLLTRYEQIEQQGSFPISTVRVLATSEIPTRPAAPGTARTLALWIVIGILLASFVGIWREYKERFFRTGEDVVRSLGLRFLGYLPLELGKQKKANWLSRLFWGKAALEKQRRIERARPLFMSIQEPQSLFAETLRNVRIACDVTNDGERCRVIGVSSVLPGEGKSTVSSNLANLLSVSGHKTLLVDGDLRNPGLSRAMNITSGAGIVDLAMGEKDWKETVRNIGVSKLHMIPCVRRKHLSHTSELLQSRAFDEFMSEARTRYDYIVVDLPPIGPVVDTKAVLPQLSKLVFVAEWGKTSRAIVRQTLQSEPAIRSKIVGLVLNKVEFRDLPKFSDRDRPEAYLQAYSAYHNPTS